MEELILASKSPRRLSLLREAGVEPTVASFDTDKTTDPSLTPEETVCDLAKRKALAARDRLGDDKLILSADTVVALGNTIFGKPTDDEDAKRILHTLSGTRHRVLTGVCITRGEKSICRYDCTYITFKELSDREIDEYVATGEPRDKAGAYAIQEHADSFVLRVDGNFDNVVGLPVALCRSILKDEFDTEL